MSASPDKTKDSKAPEGVDQKAPPRTPARSVKERAVLEFNTPAREARTPFVINDEVRRREAMRKPDQMDWVKIPKKESKSAQKRFNYQYRFRNDHTLKDEERHPWVETNPHINTKVVVPEEDVQHDYDPDVDPVIKAVAKQRQWELAHFDEDVNRLCVNLAREENKPEMTTSDI